MGFNAVFFGWNRSIPGREQRSAEHFQDFVNYLGAQQKSNKIESFDTVFLDTHGGDMNGFFLIRGHSDQLSALVNSDDWATHMVRASMHLENAGSVRAFTGDAVMARMELWKGHIPG
jgi:uncharacterized protein with GYD domain